MARLKIAVSLFIFSCVALTALQCCAQPAIKVGFDATEWDFGTIEEIDGPVTHRFTLTNKGRSAIVIENILASCGCTSPKYDREPVKSGNKAVMEVRFDPKDFSGHVRKSLTVVISDGKKRQHIQLYVTADVIPRPMTIEEEFPLALDQGLRLSGLHAPFGYIQHGTVRTDTLKLLNNSEKDIRLGVIDPAGTGLLKVRVPDILKPGERALATVTYDLSGTNSLYGMISDRVYFTVNGKQVNLPVNANAIVVDDFSTTDPDTAPKLSLDPIFHNFGKAAKGETLSKEIAVTNTGHAPLIIRNVSPGKNIQCDLKEGTVIKADEIVNATVTMTIPKDGRGVISGRVIIISNDPERPMREFRTAAEIQAK